MTKNLALVLLLALTSAAPNAQDTLWVVAEDGSGDFTDFPAAIAAASTGDGLLVRPGSYSGLNETTGLKALTIFSDGTGPATVTSSALLVGGETHIQNVAAGETFLLRGLELISDGELIFNPGQSLFLSSNDGDVWIEDCSIHSPSGTAALSVNFSRSTVLARSEVDARGSNGFATPGILATNARLASYETVVIGDDGSPVQCSSCGPVGVQGAAGGGVHLSEAVLPEIPAELFASGGSFLGGEGGSSVAGCLPPFGAAGGFGGSGLALLKPDTFAATLGTQLVGGAGGLGSGPCGDGPDGQAVGTEDGVHTALPGTPAWAEVPAPLVEGASATLSIHGEPGSLVLLLVSPRTVHGTLPGVDGPLLIAAPLQAFVLPSVPPSGTLDIPVMGPDLGAADFTVRYLQPALVTPSGQVQLGGVTTLILVNDSF